jgi:hypothetical protein
MAMVLAAGQHGPGDARQFISDRHYKFIVWNTLRQPPHPLPESPGVVLNAKQYRAGAVDQHATQINVAALADAVEFLLPPGRVLSRYHPNPSCEVAAATKDRAVADGSDGGGGDQWAEADKMYTYDSFNSLGEADHAKGTVDGDTWTWRSETRMGPRTIKGRLTIKMLSATAYNFKFEMSPMVPPGIQCGKAKTEEIERRRSSVTRRFV